MCRSTAPATPCSFCNKLFANARFPSTLNPTICTSIGEGRPKFNIWVIMSAGRNANVVDGYRAASLVRSSRTKSAEDRLVFVEIDEYIGIPRTDRRGSAVCRLMPL